MNRLHCIAGEEKHGGRTVHPVEPAPACLPPLNLYPLVKPHAEIARMWARARTNLLAEHDKLDRAIEALDGPKRRAVPLGRARLHLRSATERSTLPVGRPSRKPQGSVGLRSG